MLILIGTVPTAYALNHAIGADRVQASTRRASAPRKHSPGTAAMAAAQILGKT